MTEFFNEPLSLNVVIQLLLLCKSYLSIFHCNFVKETGVITLLLSGLDPIYDHVFVWLIESYETKYVFSWNSALYSWSVFSHLEYQPSFATTLPLKIVGLCRKLSPMTWWLGVILFFFFSLSAAILRYIFRITVLL